MKKKGRELVVIGNNKKVIWLASVAVIAVIMVFSLSGNNFGIANITGSTVNEIEISKSVENYFKNYLLQPGVEIEVRSIMEEKGLYKVNILIDTESLDAYVTKDGEIFFTGFIDLTTPPQAA